MKTKEDRFFEYVDRISTMIYKVFALAACYILTRASRLKDDYLFVTEYNLILEEAIDALNHKNY